MGVFRIVFILRALQGLSIGGEIPTATVYIAEKCNDSHVQYNVMSFFEHDGPKTGIYLGFLSLFCNGRFRCIVIS